MNANQYIQQLQNLTTEAMASGHVSSLEIIGALRLVEADARDLIKAAAMREMAKGIVAIHQPLPNRRIAE
jgi:hypothetical protein